MPAEPTRRSILHGCRVLVVEDDYYLATDAQHGLEDAGAIVLGPCGRVEDGLDMINAEPPDCAVVDINLGDGPRFDVPAQLLARAIPFLFLTGYDSSVIPLGYAGIPRLQKPVDKFRLVESVARLWRAHTI